MSFIRFAGHDRRDCPSRFEVLDTRIFGRSLVENGVVIDLSQMKTVTVDPDTRTANSSWSNGWRPDRAQQYGLVNNHRNDLQRWHGWTYLRRGYGSLIGAYGLADNLLSAQVVTADGQLS